MIRLLILFALAASAMPCDAREEITHEALALAAAWQHNPYKTLPKTLRETRLGHLKTLQQESDHIFWEQLRRSLYGFLRRQHILINDSDVDEVVQITVLKLFLHTSKIDSPDARLSSYAFRAALMNALDFLRSQTNRRKRFSALDDVLETSVPTAQNHAPDDLSLNTLRKEIAIALNKIPPGFRDPLLLQHYVGMTAEEVAQRLGLKTQAVKTRVFRAREKMRQRLGKSFDVNLSNTGAKGPHHAKVNQAIRNFYSADQVIEIPKEVRGKVLQQLAIEKKSTLGRFIFNRTYKVFLCGDDGTKELTPGQTTHAGIRDGAIYIAKGEYLRLLRKSPKTHRDVTARIAHEARELFLWRRFASDSEIGIAHIRQWIGVNLLQAQALNRIFHEDGMTLERIIAKDVTLGSLEPSQEATDINIQSPPTRDDRAQTIVQWLAHHGMPTDLRDFTKTQIRMMNTYLKNSERPREAYMEIHHTTDTGATGTEKEVLIKLKSFQPSHPQSVASEKPLVAWTPLSEFPQIPATRLLWKELGAHLDRWNTLRSDVFEMLIQSLEGRPDEPVDHALFTEDGWLMLEWSALQARFMDWQRDSFENAKISKTTSEGVSLHALNWMERWRTHLMKMDERVGVLSGHSPRAVITTAA